jgi:hypothetical protein
MTREEFQQIASEVGPLDDAITSVLQVADNQWAIALSDEQVELELSDDGDKLVVTATIGIPPQKRLQAILEALLAYSVLWRETGGVRAALPARTEAAVLIADLATSGLTARFLAAATRDMVGKAVAWRMFFAGRNDANPIGAPVGDATMIRI